MVDSNKTVQIDFFAQSPGEGTRYIVSKYTSVLVESVLKNLEEFSLKIHLKQKTLEQLYSAIVCVEDDIKPHVEKILKSIIYKLVLDEEPEIANRTLKIAELLGLYIPTDYILPMIVEHLNDQEAKA
jgi:hypothetical protein